MKFTVCGYNQTALMEHNLTFDDVIILKIISSIYFSNSEKITSLIYENCRYIWLSYKYIHQEIPIIGSERKLIRKIASLVEKGFLKKIIKHYKNGKQGNFIYFALGEKYKYLTNENNENFENNNMMTKCHKDNDKMSPNQMTKCHNKNQLYYINNTNIKNKYTKPENCPPFIADIMKKYEELGLPDYEFLPENSVFVNCIQALGAEKLMKALEIISRSEYARTFSINMIFSVKNLKKALNGNFRDRTKPNAVPFIEPEYHEDEETLKAFERLGL